ncbi:helix-turn-helix domain-containing protein [Stenotrophomonas maltophilia]|uniref:helix-turn-helix domain-containing protein n=1 Tax=Stenotrophomonas maltophilia TaxID=40324 RepID=UPI00069CED65|nr:helix-turn-helix domain-containing protein [Stenotrophomonas maltophilia]
MVFDRYPNGGGEMLLALALADHAHDDGTHIFPSIARLAEKTRQSERSVQYQLRRMEQSGWLVLVNAGIGGRRSGFGEGGRTRQYRINPEWMKGADIAPFAKGAKQASEGCKTTQERVQNGVEKGATAIAPEPRATKSNQEQPSHRECEREADPLALTAEQVDRELAGFGSTPTGVDREQLARFVRHRAAIRRPLSVQGWLQVRQQLLDLIAAGHDPNESLKQTMAAGLALPVIPVAQQSAGATHASHQHGSADRIEQLQQQFEAQRRGDGDGHGAGVDPAEFVDAEFAVVG